jgi:hypothetical protein
MAISGGDGSIILTTKVDQTGIKKGLSSIKKGFKVVAVAAATATVAITKMAVSAYADYEQLIGGVETLFKNSADKVKAYAENAFATAGLSANEYMQNVTAFSASLISSLGGDTEKAADVANQAIISIADNVNKMGSDYASVQNAFQGFAKQQYMLLDNLKLGYGGTKTEMERLLKDAEAYRASMGETVDYEISNLADVYTAIADIQEKLGIAGTTAEEAEKTISGSAAMMKASWQNLVSAIAGGGDIDKAMNNFVYSVQTYFRNIVPVVERALQGIGVVIERIAPMLVQTVARALIKAIPSLLNAIYQMIIGLGKGIYQGIIDLFSKEEEKIFEKQVNEMDKSVESQKDLKKAIKETNKEAKKGLASFDEINTLTESAVENTEELDIVTPATSGGVGFGNNADGSQYEQEISETLLAIMGTVAIAMVAIGLILLFTGNIAGGVGYIIKGAALLGVTMGLASKFGYDGIINMLTTIMGIAGGALLALGIILLWIGGVVGTPIAIGMIIAGAALIVSAVAAKAAFSPDDVGGWLSLIMGIAGGALLALGIILCMVGSVPLGVGMIIAGAIGLVSAVALNFDSVKNSITGWVAVIMAIAGAALLVLGIILCATGAALPLGIALIMAGAVALVTPIALNWNAIVDWIKGAWSAVKKFWNNYIAPIFTAQWWANLGKKAINGLISGFEGGINGIIKAFESMINWIVDGLNKISFDIPDWLGGGSFGINLPRANFGRIKIPRLAQGAVIPPNREFLAVLGDQKQGTNIEAPLDTIKQAVAEVLAQVSVGGGYNGRIEVPVSINGREILRAVREAESDVGSQTVFGGFSIAY